MTISPFHVLHALWYVRACVRACVSGYVSHMKYDIRKTRQLTILPFMCQQLVVGAVQPTPGSTIASAQAVVLVISWWFLPNSWMSLASAEIVKVRQLIRQAIHAHVDYTQECLILITPSLQAFHSVPLCHQVDWCWYRFKWPTLK